jgi:K+/H+ antiporter YhaU regulatory subunit KhtT
VLTFLETERLAEYFELSNDLQALFVKNSKKSTKKRTEQIDKIMDKMDDIWNEMTSSEQYYATLYMEGREKAEKDKKELKK